MLAEYSDEHARLFAEDEEAAYFRSTDELIEKVRFYLAHEERRAAIAAAGRARCVTGGYRHEDRVKFMVDTMLAMNGGGR